MGKQTGQSITHKHGSMLQNIFAFTKKEQHGRAGGPDTTVLKSMKQLSSVCVPIEQTTENSVVTTRWADWKASKPSSSSSQKGMWRLHVHSNHLESPANSGAHGHTFWYWHGGRTGHSSLSPGIPSSEQIWVA